MWLGNGMQQRQLQQYEQVQQCQQCHHCGFQRGTVLRYFESDSVGFAILVDVGLQRYQQNMMYHVVFAKSQAANVSAFGPKLLNLLSTMTLLAHVGTFSTAEAVLTPYLSDRILGLRGLEIGASAGFNSSAVSNFGPL